MYLSRHIKDNRYSFSVKYFVRCFSLDKYRNQSMKPTLFGDVASPPVRATMMTASMLNYDYKFYELNIFASEHKTGFYEKINPLFKVPAFSLGNRIINDSHAIIMYLCRESKTDLLYPEGSAERAEVDQMMFFNAGSLFPVDSHIFSKYFAGVWPADEEKVAEWYRLMDYLELRLRERLYLAGNRVFICDLSCGATISSLELLIPLDRYEHIKKWLNSLNELPCFEINARGLKRLKAYVEKIKKLL